MTRLKMGTWFVAFLGVLFVCAGSACATDISGTITTTLAVMDNSKLVGDVTCTVSGAPCLDIAASNVTLDLNGFSITGLGDPQTGCAGGNSPGAEHGIRILNQTGVTIRGAGIVQRFRAHGILISGSTGTQVTGVTTSTNCEAGILVAGGSNVLENNISIANGNVSLPCGGI